MRSQLYALIIGVNHYQSGAIWNLNSCVDDAKRVKRFLVHELNVSRDQICVLLDYQATKKAIEDSFMNHLINNPAIERGDAILVYFAGHGSTVLAPKQWYGGGVYVPNRKVEVLCSYDHDTKQLEGRVAGISDRSMHALFGELARAKGNNITFIVDCCFSPTLSGGKTLDRKSTRWTPTTRCKPDDLYGGLWIGARGQPNPIGVGFYTTQCDTHVFLAACSKGGLAMERKDGGRFTNSILEAASELSLHRTSYVTLFNYIHHKIGLAEQRPICLGKYKSRIIFDAIPFVVDPRFMYVDLTDGAQPRIDVGAVHGIVKGSELSLHVHNHSASRNPIIGTLVVSKVHPTWCLGHLKSPMEYLPKVGWAQVTRWNMSSPFRVYLKANFTSLRKSWKLHQILSVKASGPASKTGLDVVLAKSPEEANIQTTVGHRILLVKRNEDKTVDHVRQISKFVDQDSTDVIDDAARFNLHLHRRNSNSPLIGFVNMELFRLNHTSRTTTSENLLIDGKANISFEDGGIFKVVISNNSHVDLWPYLFYMDPNSFSITKIFGPESPPSHNKIAPLPRGCRLSVGFGQSGSEALSFVPGDDPSHNFGYLKLFLTSKPVSFGIIEQSHLSESSPFRDGEQRSSPNSTGQIWDTLLGTLCFTN